MTHPLRLVVAFFLGVAAFTAFIGAAKAAPALRSVVTVTRDIVVLGDLISDAGALAGTPIFRAPDHGLTGTLSADSVIAAARKAGLEISSNGAIREISVTRSGRAAGKAEIEGAIRLALADHTRSPAPENIDISFEGEPLLTADTAENARVEANILRWSAENGVFEATISLTANGRTLVRQNITGNAMDGIDVVVAATSITRKKTLDPQDLTIVRLPRRQVTADMVQDIAEAVGMSTKRAMRGNDVIRNGDLEKPILVERGATVTIVHAVPGMTLTARGQALSAGAKGTAVSVMNNQSKRVIDATVTGTGQVTVTTGHAAVVLSAR